MPTFNAVNAARIAAVPSTKIAPGEIKGEGIFAFDEFVTAAILAAADIIVTGIVIPAGKRIKELTLIVPAGGGTVSVGIVGNVSKYITNQAAGTSLIVPILATASTADETLILTVAGVPAAAGTYKLASVAVR